MNINTIRLGVSDLSVSRIALGCMQLGGGWNPDEPLTEETLKVAARAFRAAIDSGISFFDHADIYCHGKSEEAFAAALAESPHLRSSIQIQTKCGIVLPDAAQGGGVKRYDCSFDHITASVEGSLKRLRTDYIDVLLLHRPDPLMIPEEVARAFSRLRSAGKVRWFGVSNFSPAQITCLQRCLDVPLVTNQLQLSLSHPDIISEGIYFNTSESRAVRRTEGVLDFCRTHQITVQAWSPLGGGIFGKSATVESPHRANILADIARQHGVSEQTVALAWIQAHPAGIVPVVGSRTPERIRQAVESWNITLSRVEWYQLLSSALGDLP